MNTASIIRVFKNSDANHVIGGGVLFSQGRAITCAHVITQALGRNISAQRREIVLIDFPFTSDRRKWEATITKWPSGSINADWASDIAVLEIKDPVVETLLPAQFFSKFDVNSTPRVRVFGFPKNFPYGQYLDGELHGVLINGVIQVHVNGSTFEYGAEHGYSGSPVWMVGDPEATGFGRVVGIITRIDDDTRKRGVLGGTSGAHITFMIPIEKLEQFMGESLAPASQSVVLSVTPPVFDDAAPEKIESPESLLKFVDLDRKEDFVGREQLLKDRILSALKNGLRILITGIGGAGKTSLAALAAYRFMEDSPNQNKDDTSISIKSVIWLESKNIRAETLPAAFVKLLSEDQSKSPMSADFAKLFEKISLVVLDDVRDAEVIDKVKRIIPPKVPLVVTSRFKLDMSPSIDITALTPADALKLLESYAERDLSLDEAAPELCQRLGYWAFGLRLVGKLLARGQTTCRDFLQSLASDPANAPIFNQPASDHLTQITYKEVMEESLKTVREHVSPQAKPFVEKIFQAFGAAFTSSSSLDFLTCYTCVPRDLVKQVLDKLIDYGLVYTVWVNDILVYHVHDVSFAYLRMLRSETDADDRHILACYLQFIRRQKFNSDYLHAERNNLIGALKVSQQDKDKKYIFLNMMHYLTIYNGEPSYFEKRGHSSASFSLLKDAIEIALREGRSKIAHYLFSHKGNFHADFEKNTDRALESYHRAYDMAVDANLSTRQRILLSVMGKNYSDKGEFETAYAKINEAYELAVAAKDDLALSSILEHKAYLATRRERWGEAIEAYRETLVIAEKLGRNKALFYAHLNIGGSEQMLGHLQEAIPNYESAYQVAVRAKMKLWQGYALQGMGEAYDLMGKITEAQKKFESALEVYHEIESIGEVKDLLQLIADTGREYQIDRKYTELVQARS